MRLNRPTITVETLVTSLADVTNRPHDDDVRLVSAEFWRRTDGAAGYHGNVVELVLGLEPPDGARWVDSELYHPAPTLTLHTFGDSVGAVLHAVEDFLAGSGRHGTVTAVAVNEHNAGEYRGRVVVRLSEGRPV